MKNYIVIFLLGIIFLGCSDSTQQAITPKDIQIMQQKSLLLEDDEDTNDEKEIYFIDSKNKKFYKNSNFISNNIDQKIDILLNSIFYKAKFRKRKVYISVILDRNVRDRDEIMFSIQKYTTNNKKYILANTDKESLEAIKNTLKIEQDGIYSGDNNIKLRHKSDVILYISTKNNLLIAKLLEKNGKIIATDSIDLNKNWVKVKVPRTDGGIEYFLVMIKPVTVGEFYGNNINDRSVTNISFSQANNYCHKRNEEIMDLYVFEYARRAQAIKRPSANVNLEMIAPYDEDYDEEFYREGDEVESEDGTMVIFNWNNEKYFATFDLFKASNTTFRCMRRENNEDF